MLLDVKTIYTQSKRAVDRLMFVQTFKLKAKKSEALLLRQIRSKLAWPSSKENRKMYFLYLQKYYRVSPF